MREGRERMTGCRAVYPGSGFTAAETEFMLAMDEYKRRTGRRFPTCSEVLAVAISLGYRKAEKGKT